MAMHSTILTRCLRTTPLSLFRQQIPKQPQQLSYWSPKTTTRAYSTNPNPREENDGSEKPAANEATTDSNNNSSSSSESTTTTTTSSSATNTESFRAHELVSEAEKGKERTKRLLDSLRLKRGEKALRSSMNSLSRGIQEINAQPEEKSLQRKFTPASETKPLADDSQPPPATELNSVANRILSTTANDRKPKPMIKTVPMKLGPKLGRQIMVQSDRGMDCASAIRTLESSCRANGLRRQEANQRFHVRRGQLRKNLRIQRWRKLFKFSFLETVKKIDRMRDQGW